MRKSSTPGSLFIGHVIGGSFGLVFILVNGGLVPIAARWALSVVSVLAFVFVLVVFVRSTTSQGGQSRPAVGFTGRYWLVVAGEAILLFGGLAILRPIEPATALGWIALIVGIHFVPLALLWREGRRELLTIGSLMVGLGLVGLALAFSTSDGPLVSLISGVGSGVVLLGSAVLGAIRAVGGSRSQHG